MDTGKAPVNRKGAGRSEELGPQATRKLTLAAVLAVVLLALIAGCGKKGGPLSLSQYKKEVSAIHDELAMGLGEGLQELPSLDPRDYQQLQGLKELYDRLSGLFRSSYAATSSLEPPEEAENLHRFLLEFYAAGEKAMGGSAAGIGFTRSVLPMLADMENLALVHLPEGADAAAVHAAADEDVATLEDYLRDVEGMKVIPELQERHGLLVESFRHLKEGAEAVRSGYGEENKAPLEEFLARYESRKGIFERTERELVEWVAGREARVDHLLQVGRDLGKMIYELR